MNSCSFLSDMALLSIPVDDGRKQRVIVTELLQDVTENSIPTGGIKTLLLYQRKAQSYLEQLRQRRMNLNLPCSWRVAGS